nr:MAG TPA: Homocysteine S-methyltransferase [Caudoviricetes sp.]
MPPEYPWRLFTVKWAAGGCCSTQPAISSCLEVTS